MENKYRCPTCKSENTVWRGYRYNQSGKHHLRKCNDCDRKFTPDDGFLRMRKPKDAILEAISLYNDGLSLSKVKNHLWQHHGVKVSRWMILRWVRKYSKLLVGYTSKLKPTIKGSIHSDEVIVKVKGDDNWRWGSIDRVTKYKFSGPLTKTRRRQGAICLYRRIKDQAKNRPGKLISDKLVCLNIRA